jgi:hypothetical protein
MVWKRHDKCKQRNQHHFFHQATVQQQQQQEGPEGVGMESLKKKDAKAASSPFSS